MSSAATEKVVHRYVQIAVTMNRLIQDWVDLKESMEYSASTSVRSLTLMHL